MRVTRDEILDAVDELQSGAACNLCGAFYHGAMTGIETYDNLPRYLRAIGGRMDIIEAFWPYSDQGRDQRLTFLAFMLTWWDDIAATSPPTRSSAMGNGG